MCLRNETECVTRSEEGQWAWVAADSLLFVMILCGNLFTMYILRSSRIISNRFVLSLAVTDTLVGLTLPYHAAFTIFPALSRSRTTCIIKFVFVLMACCCSILNVMAIAFDRYLAILHPFKYETLMTKSVVRRILFFAGIFAVGLSTVPLYWNNWNEYTMCELGQILPIGYIIAVLLPAFLVIWAAMIGIYSRIWHEAVAQAEKLRRTNICHQCRPSFQVVLLVMGCFTICWLPFLMVACAQAAGFRDRIPTNVYKAVLCLALSSSALNPIIYAWKNAEFKEAVRSVIKCNRSPVPPPSTSNQVTVAVEKNFTNQQPQTSV